MGNKCCGPSSTITNCDLDHAEYSNGGIMRRNNKHGIMRQSSQKMSRNIEGMKRQIDEQYQSANGSSAISTSNSIQTIRLSQARLVESDDHAMSFLKGADIDDLRDTMDYNPTDIRQTGILAEPKYLDEYPEWDKVTNRNDEHFEISSEARDYNEQEFDETKSEIHQEELNEPETGPRDVYFDPFSKVDGGMASTEAFVLWKTLMPVFAEMTRLDYFKQEIRAGNKQYKDFYVYFRQNLLEKFDNAVGEAVSSFRTNQPAECKSTINIRFWRMLPWDIRVKTYLTLYAIEIEAQRAQEEDELSEREINILRWAALLLHIGCAKNSKTSKIYIYSFLSALFLTQMLECGDIPQELLEGSAYQEMQLMTHTIERQSVDLQGPDSFVSVSVSKSGESIQQDVNMKEAASKHNNQKIQAKQRDLRFKAVSELIQASRQPLQPGILAFQDRLFSEQGKPITSMPSHHNLIRLFEIINESSRSLFHEMEIQHQETLNAELRAS